MDYETLLSQLEASRPDLSDSLSLIRQYQKQKQETESQEAEESEKDSRETLKAIIGKQISINRNLFHQYQQMEDNCQALVAHLNQLAEALGACTECWGEDTYCDYCGGRGRPGYFRPDQHYFEQYIKPVISKLKTTKQVSNNN